jgi:hypothetical protein
MWKIGVKKETVLRWIPPEYRHSKNVRVSGGGRRDLDDCG